MDWIRAIFPKKFQLGYWTSRHSLSIKSIFLESSRNKLSIFQKNFLHHAVSRSLIAWDHCFLTFRGRPSENIRKNPKTVLRPARPEQSLGPMTPIRSLAQRSRVRAGVKVGRMGTRSSWEHAAEFRRGWGIRALRGCDAEGFLVQCGQRESRNRAARSSATCATRSKNPPQSP